MNEHIQEIQDLYKENEDKREGRVEDKEVILIKPYKVDESTSTTNYCHKLYSACISTTSRPIFTN